MQLDHGAVDEMAESPPSQGGVCGFEARQRYVKVIEPGEAS